MNITQTLITISLYTPILLESKWFKFSVNINFSDSYVRTLLQQKRQRTIIAYTFSSLLSEKSKIFDAITFFYILLLLYIYLLPLIILVTQ